MTDMVLCGELSVPNHTEVEPFSYSISLGKKYWTGGRNRRHVTSPLFLIKSMRWNSPDIPSRIPGSLHKTCNHTNLFEKLEFLWSHPFVSPHPNSYTTNVYTSTNVCRVVITLFSYPQTWRREVSRTRERQCQCLCTQIHPIPTQLTPNSHEIIRQDAWWCC